MYKLVNLTKHEIVLVEKGEIVATIPPSGVEARAAQEAEFVREIKIQGGATITLRHPVYGEVQNLPEPQKELLFLVSGRVREAVKEREDVLSPGALLRDERGIPQGCDGLYTNQENV